jgi:hypothetical protein
MKEKTFMKEETLIQYLRGAHNSLSDLLNASCLTPELYKLALARRKAISWLLDTYEKELASE